MKLLKTLPISAASGLVLANNSFFCIADDENDLLELRGEESFMISLLDGKLPEDHKKRKKQKADFEALALLERTILAFPSGSTENRMKGMAYAIDSKVKTPFHLSGLYSKLSFAELNIEGATVVEDEIWLFQRGNGASRENGVIVLDKKAFLKAPESSLKKVHHIILPQDFGFTDACFAQGKIFFLAVHEATTSTYDDGKFSGASLGVMNRKFGIEKLLPLSIDQKPEGIWVQDKKIYLVTDADDRSVSSSLWELTSPF